MRRGYNAVMFVGKIKRVKILRPDVCIGIDIIVGFPGETETDFCDTYRFLESMEPAFLHVFPYSERDNTPAIHFEGKVSPADAASRVTRLTELSDRLHRRFCERYIGMERPVLIEGTKKGKMMFGYTDNYIKVEVPYRKELINEIVQVKLSGITDEGIVLGEVRFYSDMIVIFHEGYML